MCSVSDNPGCEVAQLSVLLSERWHPQTDALYILLLLLLQRELVRQVNEPSQLQLVPCFGYVSLFPLMMQLLPADSHELGQQLQLLRQEQLLWTDHGLRSLAPTSSIYKK
jgi:hypothetical protein